MTKLRRQSLTAYEAPLCETIVDCPEPKDSEVLVRIERCGVCHSDLHMQDGYFLLSEGKRLDVNATPSVFVNGKKLEQIGGFLKAIESESKRLGLPMPSP